MAVAIPFELEPDTASSSGFSLRVDTVERVDTWRITFEGFDRRRVAVPMLGTWRQVVAWTSTLVSAGCRDVRYQYPDDYGQGLGGLEVTVRPRRRGTSHV